MKRLPDTYKILILLISSTLISFCIISNSEGEYRRYLAEDLPLVVQMNVDTPVEFDTVVADAFNKWNNVEGSYFEFALGERTPTNAPGGDGINLLYFDYNYDNFAKGELVIAFSQTRSTTEGGYHAIESDYIYNAAGYPPGIDGNPNQMDLKTLTLHEVGHHMGLSHNGPDGNQSGAGSQGCGISLPGSVMYFSVATGQIKRKIDPHAEMGAASIYPNYIMDITITDSENGDPIENAKINLNDNTKAAVLGDVEGSLVQYGGLIPGEVYTSIPTPETGKIRAIMSKQSFSFDVYKFGYQQVATENVSFSQPAGYDDTQFLAFIYILQKLPKVQLNGNLTSNTSGNKINAEILAEWVGDKEENFITTCETSGNFTMEIPQGYYYNIDIYVDPPYKYKYEFDSVYVGENGYELNMDLNPTKLLVVNSEDTENSNYYSYLESLKKLGISFSFWDENKKGNIAEQNFISSYPSEYAILWNAGGEESSGMDEADFSFLENHLREGNGLFLTGDNIAQYASVSNVLLNNYLGVKFLDNTGDNRLRGFSKDAIGGGINSVFNVKDKDILQLTATNLGDVYKSFYVGTTNIDSGNIVAVRSENSAEGWRTFFLSSGLYHLYGNKFDSLLFRSIEYILDTNFVLTGTDLNNKDDLLQKYSLSQNYPNPFNPSSKISFSLPSTELVNISVYNIIGQKVVELVNKNYEKGIHVIEWNASNLSSGIYLIKLSAGKFSAVQKAILLK